MNCVSTVVVACAHCSQNVTFDLYHLVLVFTLKVGFMSVYVNTAALFHTRNKLTAAIDVVYRQKTVYIMEYGKYGIGIVQLTQKRWRGGASE